MTKNFLNFFFFWKLNEIKNVRFARNVPFERQQREKDSRWMACVQCSQYSDFSIVSLSLFDSIVRARALVPVYVPLTLVCRVRARVCVSVIFSLILYFIFITSRYLVPTPYDLCLYDECWTPLLLFFFGPPRIVQVCASNDLSAVHVPDWHQCSVFRMTGTCVRVK